MGQKCEGNCGLWVLNEIIKIIYPENLKKNRGSRLVCTGKNLEFLKIFFSNIIFSEIHANDDESTYRLVSSTF
jgi:hypothetical protein